MRSSWVVAPRLPTLAVALAVTVAGLVAGGAEARAGKREMERIHTIVLDPGHGGENLGALGVHGIYEKVIVLDIAREVERLLAERTDARVYLTRRDDRYIGLRERTRFANQVGADVFLSIHCNSEEGHRASGVETFFLSAEASDEEAARLVAFENQRLEETKEPEDSDDREVALMLKDLTIHAAHQDAEELAAVVQERLVRRTSTRSRGVKQAPFAVLKEAEMPAIVIEVGFLSHPEEARQLIEESRQKAIARAIVEALIAFDHASRYR